MHVRFVTPVTPQVKTAFARTVREDKVVLQTESDPVDGARTKLVDDVMADTETVDVMVTSDNVVLMYTTSLEPGTEEFQFAAVDHNPSPAEPVHTMTAAFTDDSGRHSRVRRATIRIFRKGLFARVLPPDWQGGAMLAFLFFSLFYCVLGAPEWKIEINPIGDFRPQFIPAIRYVNFNYGLLLGGYLDGVSNRIFLSTDAGSHYEVQALICLFIDRFVSGAARCPRPEHCLHSCQSVSQRHLRHRRQLRAGL